MSVYSAPTRSTLTGVQKSAPVKARIPLHRLGMPLEIADLVLCLALSASDVICGQVLLIDGGYGAV